MNPAAAGLRERMSRTGGAKCAAMSMGSMPGRPVRNSERLVVVQMADIRADGGRAQSPTCAFMFAPSM
jgi:hypothetical protein